MSKLTHRLAALFALAAIVFTVGSASAAEYKVSTGEGGIVVQAVDLPSGEVFGVVLAYGDKNYGENLTDWPSYEVIGAVEAGDTLTIPYPEGWGASVGELAVFIIRSEDAVFNSPDAYIRRGLAAQWDALDGVVLDEESGKPVEWVDRINGYAFPLNGCTINADGTIDLASVQELAGDDAAEVSSALLDTGINTLEWTLTWKGGSYLFTGTAASQIIFAFYNNNFILSNNRDLDRGLLKSSVPLSTYAVTYDHSGTTRETFITDRYCNGNVASGTSSYWDAGGSKMRLGNKTEGGTANYGSLRIYNRRLTPAEVNFNSRVDAARYRGGAATANALARSVCVAKVSPVDGISYRVAVEPVCCSITGAGWYRDGEQVTVTAIPFERCNFVRWDMGVPAGCSATEATLGFELHGGFDFRAWSGHPIAIDAINRDAEEKPVSAVLSFDTTGATNTLFMAYGKTDEGTALASWDHVDPVGVVAPEIASRVVPFPDGWGDAEGPKFVRFFLRTGVGTESVIRKNLLAHWDAIDNQATGVHDATATGTWVDLVNQRAFALTGATVDEDAINLTADGSYGFLGGADTSATIAYSTARTIEMRVAAPSNGKFVILEAPAASGVAINQYDPQYYYTAYKTGKVAASMRTKWRSMENALTFGYSGESCTALYINGIEPLDIRSDTWTELKAPAEGAYLGCDSDLSKKMAGRIQMLRVYEGLPDQATMNNNVIADSARFVDGLSLGGAESYSDTLNPQSDIHGTFRVSASVPHGTVLGVGEHEAGSVVTLTVEMEEGYTFYRWLGDLPEGSDAYSPTLTFAAVSHVNLTGFILMPWEVVTDANGAVTKVTNSVWTIGASATGKNVTLLPPAKVSDLGYAEKIDGSLDFTDFEQWTGYRITVIGDSVFANIPRLKSAKFVGEDLIEIGANAFVGSTCAFEPGTLPNLEVLGGGSGLGVSDFAAPKLRVCGSHCLPESVRSFQPTTISWAIERSMFSGFAKLTGAFVIDSPSTTIPYSAFWYCNKVESFTIKSKVEIVDEWAFNGCSPSLKIYWDVPPPKRVAASNPTIGTYDAEDVEAGGMGLTKPTPQLIAGKFKTVEGFKSVQGLSFIPLEELDAKYLTEAYGYTSRCVGLLNNQSGNVPGFIWLVRPPYGTVFRVK